MSPELRGSPEDRKKEMDRLKKEAEKHGFEMVYWGHPYGMSENIVAVFKSEKALDVYHSMNIGMPFIDTRTDIVVIP